MGYCVPIKVEILNRLYQVSKSVFKKFTVDKLIVKGCASLTLYYAAEILSQRSL